MKDHASEYVVGPKLVAAMRAYQPKLTNIRWTRLRFNDEVEVSVRSGPPSDPSRAAPLVVTGMAS